MSKSIADILALIQENNVEMVNFKMADAKGQYHQVTIPASSFSIDFIHKGINIDTATYSCVAANSGDAVFIPDLNSALLDQGSIIPTVVIPGELRYFKNNQVSPIAVQNSNDKSSLIFSIVALACGGTGLLCMLMSWLFDCCGIVAIIPYIGWVIGFVVAIVSIAFDTLGIVCGVAGIVFGAIAKKKCKVVGRSAGMASAGLILGIAAAALWILPLILSAVLAILLILFFIIMMVICIVLIVVYMIFLMLVACLMY